MSDNIPLRSPKIKYTAFVNYSVGPEIINPSTYSWASEIGVTLDQNLGLAP